MVGQGRKFWTVVTTLGFTLMLAACGGDGGTPSPAPPPGNSNTSPVASDDLAITQMNVPIDINVLSNDVDSNGDKLQVGSVTQGSEGTVSINPNGTIHYAPFANVTGRDSFTYTITDGKGGSATASVRVRMDFQDGQGIQRVSVSTNGTQGDHNSWMGASSSGGGFVAFLTFAGNLHPSGSNTGNILLHNRATLTAELVTADMNGLPTPGGQQPSVSSTGRYVAFSSGASNLVAGDTNGETDIFVRDMQQGITTRVSIASTGAQGNGPSMAPSISGDGQYIAFWSLASNLVQNDLNGSGADIFVYDSKTGITSLVSIGPSGNQIGGGAFDRGPSISDDGRHVAFPSNGQIFVRDRQTNQTTMVSVSSAGVAANSLCDLPVISSNGQVVVFTSTATNLVSGDSNGVRDIFAHDLQTGVTTRVSMATNGTEANGEVPDLNKPAISEDGRFVAFLSSATNLVAGDTNGVPDVFVRDHQTNQTVRINVDSNGNQANGPSGDSVLVSMNANGQYVVFSSQATNLVSGDTNGWMDVFVAPNPLAP